ncbi:MAG: hypothetical protein JOY93_12880, partial [Acidobacteriales bacterium]|nr:hypothetical protein [Terriglobales bacterium]
VYALIAAKKGGLYRSDDGGANWRLENEDSRLISRAWYFNGITVDPQNPEVIYVPNVALYRSEDGGKTISVLRGAPGGDDYHQLWIDPKDSSRLLLATDQGTSISLNRGETWSSWYNQPTAQFYHVTTDNQFPYMIYGAQQDSGSAAVPNRTDHGKISARDWITASGSESGYIAIDPNNPDILYDSGPFGQILRFNRRTSLSQDVTPWPAPSFGLEVAEHKYRDPWSPVLLFSPVDKTSLYLGTQYVMKTVDGGLHWETISPDLTGASGPTAPKDSPTLEEAKRGGYGVMSTIAPSFLNKDLIWAGSDTGLIHLTQDGGKTWKEVTPRGIEVWSDVTFIEASHFDPATAYAVVDRHQLDDQKPYIYETHDYGTTWQQINAGIDPHSFVRVVREDSQKRGLLFAGTEFGIYVSFDDGAHWQSLQLNLPVTSIRDIAIHDDDLVVATHGRAFWILDDIALLRQISEIPGGASAWLYSPATAVRVDNDNFPGTPLPPEEPAADNPPEGACIDYYLRNTPTNLAVDILDDQRRLVRRFSLTEPHELERSSRAIAERWFVKPAKLENSPGMHRLVWNLAWGGSNGVSTDELDDDGFLAARAPRVVPGNYEVRLSVDGKVFSQPLKVVMDPRSAATPQVLSQQLHVAQEIFAENLSTRKALREIAVVQKQISDLKKRVSGKDAATKKYLTDIEMGITGILTKDASQASAPPGLTEADADLDAVLKVVESGERAVPSQVLELFGESKYAAEIRITQWNDLKQEILASLNAKLRKAGLAPVLPGKPAHQR